MTNINAAIAAERHAMSSCTFIIWFITVGAIHGNMTMTIWLSSAAIVMRRDIVKSVNSIILLV